MTVRHNKKIERALKKNGFIRFTTHHDRYFYITLSGEDSDVKTYLSHGSKDYGDQLLFNLSQQMHLTKKDLLKFIDGEIVIVFIQETLRYNVAMRVSIKDNSIVII